MKPLTKKQLIQFCIITFAISWGIWSLGIFIPNFPVQGKILEVIGAIGPAVAALIMVGRNDGRAGLKRILANSFGAKCNWSFLFFASLLMVGLHAASRMIYGLVGENLPASEPPTLLYIIPTFILYFIIGGGLNEEIGLRGYALNRFQSKYTALISSLLLGAMVITIVYGPKTLKRG